MYRLHIELTSFVIFGAVVGVVVGIAVGDEPLLRDLPVGLIVESSAEVSKSQRQAIGRKLGGKINRLTNSVLRIHGRTIQVNVIAAADETNAKSLQSALLKIKPEPFVVRKGDVIVEYVGRAIDEAVATKTSYELGMLPKPARVRYQIQAELATVDRADYMACNPLFNRFLQLHSSSKDNAAKEISDLSKKFSFGSSLALRRLADSNPKDSYSFEPAARSSKNDGARTVFSFEDLSMRQGVPFVSVVMKVSVQGNGVERGRTPVTAKYTAPTRFWPSDEPAVRSLAARITRGKKSNEAKAHAILRWLSPGRNIKFSGQTGSRWGTEKVLQQKFGHCWDFSDCFVTIARAAGVPCRQVAGWLYGSSGHVWAEYHRGRKGWQQVDPTGGGELPCGIYHIPYFTSEDGEMPILYVAMPKIEILETK